MTNPILRAAVAAAAFALLPPVQAAGPLPPQTTSQSAVQVKVTPRNVAGPVWEFEIVFDTHSQELKDDLLATAVLVSANGVESAPTGWKGDPPGGHHRKGVLQFDAPKAATGAIELRIRRPGEAAPRTFRWQRPPP